MTATTATAAPALDLRAVLARTADGGTLTVAESAEVFGRLIAGEATPSQIGGLLMSLRVRGETVEEVVGAATAIREHMLGVAAPADAVDVVGTGGDASGSYNISTAAAFVVAGAGVPVAKHGNRALSSRCGAADVLTALGVTIDLTPGGVARCVERAGIGFMFAPAHHPALRAVATSRVELGTRTIFNLLGPLLNPAGVRRHLVGVHPARWVEPMARALGDLGSESALVVHGCDGLDEITLTGPTTVATLRGGRVTLDEIHPSDVGLRTADSGALIGGGPEENAAALRATLHGEPGPLRDVVLLNAGAALVAAGRAPSLVAGYAAAAEAVDDGRAARALDALVAVSHEHRKGASRVGSA